MENENECMMDFTTFIYARLMFNKINIVLGYSIIWVWVNYLICNQKDIVNFTGKEGVYFNKSETALELTKEASICYANRGTVELGQVYYWSSSRTYLGKDSASSLMTLAKKSSEKSG